MTARFARRLTASARVSPPWFFRFRHGTAANWRKTQTWVSRRVVHTTTASAVFKTRYCCMQISLGICRICHCNPETLPELGPLQSVCNCRGTVALVHMGCLERWLAESDSSSCELCRYQFTVQRIPKHSAFESVFIWANEVADFNQVRSMVTDNFFPLPPPRISPDSLFFHLQVQKDLLCFLTTFPLIVTLLQITMDTTGQLVLHSINFTELKPRACVGINCLLLLSVRLIHFNLKFKVHILSPPFSSLG